MQKFHSILTGGTFNPPSHGIDIPSRYFGVLTFILLFFAFLQGCGVNLPAVRDFSRTTVVAVGPFDKIVEDLPKPCINRVNLTYEGKRITTVNNQVEYNAEYKKSLAVCDDIKNSLNGIIDANYVLKGYVEALGKLASDDVVTFTAQINALEANLKKVQIGKDKPFGGTKVSAALDLAQYLVNAAAKGYRQRELKQAIEIGHQHMGPLIEGLTNVVGDYQDELETEKDRIRIIQIRLTDEREKPNDKRKLSKEEIDDKLFETVKMLESVDAKNKAAEDYKTILSKISATHKRLYESTNELDSRLLIEYMQDYAKELTPLINNVLHTFSG